MLSYLQRRLLIFNFLHFLFFFFFIYRCRFVFYYAAASEDETSKFFISLSLFPWRIFRGDPFFSFSHSDVYCADILFPRRRTILISSVLQMQEFLLLKAIYQLLIFGGRISWVGASIIDHFTTNVIFGESHHVIFQVELISRNIDRFLFFTTNLSK